MKIKKTRICFLSMGFVVAELLPFSIFLASTFHALYYYISMFMIGLAHRFMHAR